MTRQKTEIRQEQIKQVVIDIISFNIYMFTQYIDKVLTNNCPNNMEKMICYGCRSLYCRKMV
jgi:hypothetical protein